ncbi:MAG: GNAT family N-acetyltransferase [Pseudomonadota bacterium]
MVQTLDIGIAPAARSDAAELADVYRRAWSNAYSGIIPSDTLDRLVRSRDTAAWRTMIADDNVISLRVGDGLAGYATYGRARPSAARQPPRQPAGPRAEIYELYLAPEYQGVGLGEYLFEGCRHRFDERQLRGPDVWVLTDNSVARRFYHARGGRLSGRAIHRLGRVQLTKVRYSWD